MYQLLKVTSKMCSKKVLSLGLFLAFSAVVYSDRVKIDEELGNFLAALEHFESTRNDVVFLLDESGSIGVERFPEVKLFTKLTAQRLTVSSDYSRIAVATFATEPIIHIDYRTNPSDNMCTLLSQIDRIGYVGEWTHTDKAMKTAEDILASARPNSQKIIVLLTDGQSNDGHSPVAISRTLKARNITIFAVGVASVNEKEIDDVATSPNHVYILKNFDYIVKVNKYLVNDTRDISMDIAKDSSLCNSLCTEGGDCCDDNANCYCGTRSGRYECACNAGYHGRGHRNECYKCPRGTYKSSARNSECTTCPEHATTSKEGSTKFEDCSCLPGYEWYDKSCVPVKCASLNAPEGGILIPSHCNNTYGTQCSFTCRAGYCPFTCNSNNLPHQSVAAHSLQPSRTCLETRDWNGVEFHCERIACQALQFPFGGTHNCSENDFTYGSTCHYTCEKGFKLYGTEHRTCLLNGSWTGSEAQCKKIYCSQLKTRRNLQMKPKQCGEKSLPYGSVCQYFCVKGYSMVSLDNDTGGIFTCEANGKWSGGHNKISCRDTTPPVIECPPSIEVNASPSMGYAEVSWMPPNATDNIGVQNVRIIEPGGIKKPPYNFPIGSNKVVYEAIDVTKLTSTCTFSVKVFDKEPPKVISCPSNVETFFERKDALPVTWDEPVFEDNSKKPLRITSNRKSGDAFGWGPESHVIYEATDESGNAATCNFTVKVKHYPCPYYAPPANGVLTCDTWMDGRICSVFCHEGFQFTAGKGQTNFTYFCGMEKSGRKKAKWMPFPGSQKSLKLPWPDCSRKRAPSALNVTVGVSYSVDSCSEETLAKMRENFINILKPIPGGLFCPVNKGCIPENVNISCTPASHRKKRNAAPEVYHRATDRNSRDAPKQVLTITFNMEMIPPAIDQNPDTTPSDGASTGNSEYKVDLSANPVIKDLENKISENVKDAYAMTSEPDPEAHYDFIAICTVGQVKVNKFCVNCPVGTYKDDVSETCISCPKAAYQDEESRLSCKPCPVGYTTHEEKSKSADDCKAPCSSGTFSTTTFEPCLACPMNTYQQHASRKDCLKCPAGLYTWKVGANSSSDCVAPCKPGSFSDTGFEPCTLCDVDSYQDQSQQKGCNTCPNRTRASTSGSQKIDNCKEIDICEEQSPCRSGSTCIQLDKEYQCLCPEGLMGGNCEINPDDCEFSPCLNNGTCEDGIGNFTCMCLAGWSGERCEINIDDCDPNPCHNGGECIDMLNSYTCQCKIGFVGQKCEVNVYECESNPCLNNGTCFDKLNDYRCCCAKGYYGKNCEREADLCDSVKCENGGSCFSTHEEFSCTCPEGFEGEFCEVNSDDCVNFLCENGGWCTDGIGNATCNCPQQFVGARCEEALIPKFVLSFPTPSTSNYVELKNTHRLHAITVAFFMRTSFKDPNSRATPISYSYKDKSGVVDNALTLLDTNNFVLYIHGEAYHTEYSANSDTLWHHYAVTWEKTQGKWSFYVDGNALANGVNIGVGKYMHPGMFILGQEQDSLGDSFSTLEAFQGDITEFNVWDYPLTPAEIKRINSSCGFVGNVIPWYVAAKNFHGKIIISQDVDKCTELGSCSENACDCFYANEKSGDLCKYDVENCDVSICANNQPCISDEHHSFCNCSTGFEGRHCEYDVDECLENNGGCQYYCVNEIGSYHCSCPEDMLLSEDGRSCKETSFCIIDGQVYPDGESWISSCKDCTCDHGNVNCEEKICNETACHLEETVITAPGECCPKCVAWSYCLISPKNTIMTFDMSEYEIAGNCVYTAAEDCINGQFKVVIERFHNITDMTDLVIYQGCYKIILSSNGDVFVDDDVVQLPFNNDEVAIETTNSSVTVRTHSDLFVQWNFTDEALIAVPVTDTNKICGLCSRMEEYLASNFGRYTLPERIASGENECFALSEVHRQRPITTSTASINVVSYSAGSVLSILVLFLFIIVFY